MKAAGGAGLVSGGRMSASSAGTRVRAIAALAIVCFVHGMAAPGTAQAQIGSDRYAAIVADAQSGNVLMSASPDEQRYPASLTKMMTVYMAFEALRDGRIALHSPIRVSADAASMPPSRLGLAAGMTLTVEEAILALVTKSANDAAAALGEFLGGGSEYRFAQMMTLKARALGMTRTTFRNASGLPDLDQVTTARDMAQLGRRLMHEFPERFSYFSTPHFVFRGRTHWNHNRLLNEYEGTDGIKTGYVNDSGFNLVASAQRDGVRLVAAVFGGRTGRERDRHMMTILDRGFAAMGVAPRGDDGPVMAWGATPGLLARAAQAASLRLASRTVRPAAARLATVRLAAAPARSAPRAASAPRPATAPQSGVLRRTVRLEQGDGGRAAVVRGAKASRGSPPPAAAPARKARR
jgi:D-alanyl-D-alanine carboxypeptidase